MHARRRHPLVAAALLAVVSTLVWASLAFAQASEEVIISDRLEPSRLEVSTGATVTWRNEDDERHRVRSRQGPVEFDSGNLEPGERFSVTFVVAGEYPYLDERNDEDPDYFGTIIVIGDEATDGPPPMAATVTLIDESFQPPSLEVAAGATVTWENIDGDDDHTVTADDGAFDSGILPAGSAFEHTFDAPGTYPYFCAIHPEMVGTITVVGSATPPAEDPGVGSADTDSVPAPDSEPAPDEAIADEPVDVSIVDLAFDPPVVDIQTGTTVTWANDDGVPHTVTATEGAFDSGVLESGETFSRTFETPGTYPYFCAIHPSMAGTVVVSDPVADAGAGDAAATSSVSMVDVTFAPADIEVPAGTTVEWINDDPFDHTVTARDGSFDSGVMGSGATFSHSFDTPGTFDYFCAIHPTMTGTVTVISTAEG